MPDIWKHQLATPLRIMAESGHTARQKEPKMLDRPPRTFGELLAHPDPPLEILVLAKNYAKTERGRGAGPALRQIATTLYYACIAAGLRRCREKLTSLTDTEAKQGFEWVLGQPWVDDDTRVLIGNAIRCLPKIDDPTTP